MGDNRDESFDSRYFGPVQRDRIVGRATVVAASVDPERHYRPRWERFFHELR
jgi:signal peptidase I